MKMICEVVSCGEELSEGTGSKGGPMLCNGCRGPRFYWGKKSLPEKRARVARLQLFENRLEYYDPRVAEIVNDANKSVADTKKRAQAASNPRH